MADMLNLRPYQRSAIDAYQDAHLSGMNFPVIVLPTGAGKSVIIAHGAAEHIEAHSNRVLVLAHRDEIVDQIIGELHDSAPGLNIGKVKGEDDEVFADVVVASVQTASRKARLERLVASQWSTPTRKPRQFGLVITDEVHHAPAASYQTVYRAFPRSKNVGVTATLARGDGVGLGSTVDDVVFSRSWLWMIREGYLVDPVGITATVESLDLSSVRKSSGDYAAGALGDAMLDSGAGAVIAAAYAEHATDRPGIVFTPNVATAYDVAERLDWIGITADVVDAKTTREDRQLIYKRSRMGDLQVIVNCGVLTEGANFPWISAVVPRITQSAPLFQQMTGRALRLYPGKKDALVLSVGGMSGRLRTLVDLDPGVVRAVRPGESLAEAAGREEAEAARPTDAKAAPFRITVKHTDLFAASKSLWLRTEGGTMFIPVTDGEVFLWPQPGGLWQVRHAPHNVARAKLRWPVLRGDLSLDMAMAWGETEAEDLDIGSPNGRAHKVSSRASSWRKSKEAPSAGQVAACEARKIPIPEGATKAEISDVLSVWTATQKFDPFMVKTERATAVVSAD